ncbi:TRAP transporter large permease [Chelativorans sp. Marseille-P2723]|uniref:TRAP transporter large permease n=1 Tax=Chelativorans sp. Marseille-P2723 TaxID=2709133 RepID=UPI0015709EB5|nr:TRAP transporter large permease [Chelativorans sp. Marseille-P2723]
MDSNTAVAIILSASVVLMMLGAPVAVLLAFSAMGGIFLITGSVQAATGLLLATGLTVGSSVAYLVIPMFILMGALASHTGIVRELFDAAYKAVGRIPGGLAVATCLASAAFGAVTGSSVSAASAMTKVALPEMRRYGYSIRLSTGVIAASGTFAMMLPPSVMMIFYGVVAQQSIGKLLISGILPGLLSVAMFIILILFRSWANPAMAPRGPKFPAAETVRSSLKASPFIIVLVTLVGGMLFGLWTPTEASVAGVLLVGVIGFLKRNLRWSKFFDAGLDTVVTAGTVFLLVIASILFGKFLALSGITTTLTEAIIALDLSSFQLFCSLLILYIVLGTFLEGISVIALTVPLVLPIVNEAGWDLIWFGVIIVKLIEIGAMTPPVGLNIFAVQSAHPDVSSNDVIAGSVPFVIMEIVILFILFFVPDIATLLPSLMD